MRLAVIPEDSTDLVYVEVSEAEALKIETLLNQKRLPPVFTLNGVRIVTDNILGFSDKLSPADYPFEEVESQPVQQTVTDVFSRTRQSAWYQKGLAARQARTSSPAF